MPQGVSSTVMPEVPAQPPRDDRTEFRCNSKDKRRWAREAKRQGVSLADLLNHAANDYCDQMDADRASRKK